MPATFSYSTRDAELIGRTVHQYAIVSLIQAGAQGRVYRARDRRLHRDVAVKVLQRDRLPAVPCLAGEARALSRLRHPHIARIYDFVTEDQRDYMVMELVSGATLKELLEAGPLPHHEVLRLGAQLARGLAAAHDAQVIHGDIKPANLKVTRGGDLKILDFGAATVLPETLGGTATSSGLSVVGTIPYMAPELLRGEPADSRSDIFSAGVVLHEMATGERAFPQRSLAALVDAIQRAAPRPASHVNPAIPAWFDAIIARATEKERSSRYQTAAHLAEALERRRPD